MILLQALTNGAVSADWAMSYSVAIIGSLLVLICAICGYVFVSTMSAVKEEIKNIHTRIDTREDEHDELKDKHIDLATRVVLIESHHKVSAEKTADIILTKIRAAQGGGGPRKESFFDDITS